MLQNVPLYIIGWQGRWCQQHVDSAIFSFGSPEESVTFAKKEKLIASALACMGSHKDLPDNRRIDFVGIELNQKGKATRIKLIQNAVG